MPVFDMTSWSSWYGNYYRASKIQSLPRLCIIPNDIELSIDYATADDQSSCNAFIRDSAKQGRGNVGEDEYEGPFASRLEIVLGTGQVFAARDVRSQQVKAFVVVSPSIYARSMDCSLTSLYVFLERQFQANAVVYQHLMRLAVEFSQALCLGYTNALIHVASSELELLRLLRQDGFLRVGTLERCVKVAGKGLRDSILMAKCLTTTARPRRSLAETNELLDKIFPEKESLELYRASVLPTVDFLPMRYTFACGVKVVCRNMDARNEDSVVYEIWKAAAEKGQGYGVDEAPTLTFFRMTVLMDHYCVVFEEVGTRKIVGLTLLTASHYSRTNETKSGESNLFVVEEFRDRKIGSEGCVIELALMKQLGFTRSVNDALASNHQMAAIQQQHGDQGAGERGWKQLGAVPDGCFVEGYGWDDQLISVYHLDNCLEFTQLAEYSLRRESSREPREAGETVLSKL